MWHTRSRGISVGNHAFGLGAERVLQHRTGRLFLSNLHDSTRHGYHAGPRQAPLVCFPLYFVKICVLNGRHLSQLGYLPAAHRTGYPSCAAGPLVSCLAAVPADEQHCGGVCQGVSAICCLLLKRTHAVKALCCDVPRRVHRRASRFQPAW